MREGVAFVKVCLIIKLLLFIRGQKRFNWLWTVQFFRALQEEGGKKLAQE